jgi:hypothetical protein
MTSASTAPCDRVVTVINCGAVMSLPQVRARVAAIKSGLEVGLCALKDAVEGNTRYAAQQLAHLSPLCLPLLGSEIVGEWVWGLGRGPSQ